MKRYTTSLLLVCFAVVFLFGCAQQEPTAEEVISKMTEAMGGAETINSVTDRVETWQFTMYQMPPEMQGGMEGMEKGEMEHMEEDTMMEGEMGEESMTMEMVIKAKQPNMIRMDFPTPMGTMTNAYDGSTAWTNAGGQYREMEGAELQEWQDMAATWMDGYMNSTEKGYTHEYMGREMMDGEECYVLKTTDMNGNVKTNYVSTTSHQLIKTTGEMLNMAQEKENMTMTLEDYKAVDGLTLAHTVTLYDQDDEKVWQATLDEVELNTGVENSEFQPKKGMTAK